MKFRTVMIYALGMFLLGYVAFSVSTWYHWDSLGLDISLWFVVLLPLVVFGGFVMVGFVLAYRGIIKNPDVR